MNKVGRKPKPHGDLRDKGINVAVTGYEKEAFEELAVGKGITVPELMRGLIYREYPEVMRKALCVAKKRSQLEGHLG